MESTVSATLAPINDSIVRRAVKVVLDALADRASSTMLNSAGLVIKAGSSALVKTGATAFAALVDGKIVVKAAATDMAALSGTVTNLLFNVFVYYIDSAGTLTTVMGTEGASLALVKFPPTPQKKAMIGFTIINPTGTGDFVGGTTAIDDATVVPTAVHVSVLNGADPNIVLG